MGKRLALCLGVFLALFFLACPSWAAGDPDVGISYEISIHDPAEGMIDVTATFHKPSRSDLVLFEWNVTENLDLRDLWAGDGQGHTFAVDIVEESAEGFRRLSSRKVYVIRSKGASVVVVSYRVKPGAMGKHGHVGYLDERFGLVSGNSLFLFPDELPVFHKAEVRFTLPQGWGAVCPWRREGDAFFVERGRGPSSSDLLYSLGLAVIGLGNFRECQEEIRGLNIKIYTFAGWTEAHANDVCQRIFALARYQLELFGKDVAGDYAVIFVPSAKNGNRVFGGCGTLGQGFEMDEVTPRRCELFSHRLHHVFNAYDPFGIRMNKRSGGWFQEATASYYEIKALAALGYYDFEERMAQLKSDYDRERPRCDAELSRDSIVSLRIQDRAWRYQVLEFLHYKKAPLVAYLMDEKMKKETEGRKDLDGFIRHVYARHGMKKGQVDLKKELRSFTGLDFSDFFRKYVDGKEELP